MYDIERVSSRGAQLLCVLGVREMTASFCGTRILVRVSKSCPDVMFEIPSALLNALISNCFHGESTNRTPAHSKYLLCLDIEAYWR